MLMLRPDGAQARGRDYIMGRAGDAPTARACHFHVQDTAGSHLSLDKPNLYFHCACGFRYAQ